MQAISLPPPGVELEDRACPLGCPRDEEVLFVARDRFHGVSGAFSVVRCRACGLLRTNPRPTLDSIAAYYPPEYAPHWEGAPRPPAARRPGSWRRVARRLLELNVQRLPDLAPGRALEVGCASGGYLDHLRDRGWETEGIEASPAAAARARARGHRVHAGPLETAPDPERPYDLVVGWMVLEHLHEPVAALRRVRRWCAPSARLVLSVPNSASADFRFFADRGYALHVPNHLYHLTPRSLAGLLRVAGWTLDAVHHQRILSNWCGGLGRRLAARGREGPLARWLLTYPQRAGRLHYLALPLALPLAAMGQTGRMTVWASPLDA